MERKTPRAELPAQGLPIEQIGEHRPEQEQRADDGGPREVEETRSQHGFREQDPSAPADSVSARGWGATEEVSHEAVDRVDQQGSRQVGNDPATPEDGGLGDAPAAAESAAFYAEQWLERLEGNPRVLLMRQFELDERKAMRASAGRLSEPRPW